MCEAIQVLGEAEELLQYSPGDVHTGRLREGARQTDSEIEGDSSADVTR